MEPDMILCQPSGESDTELNMKLVFSAMNHRLVGFHNGLRQQADKRIHEWEANFVEVEQKISDVKKNLSDETDERVNAFRKVQMRILRSIEMSGQEIHNAMNQRLTALTDDIKTLDNAVDDMADSLDRGRLHFGTSVDAKANAILGQLVEFEEQFRRTNRERFHNEEMIREQIARSRAEIDGEMSDGDKEAGKRQKTIQEGIVEAVFQREQTLKAIREEFAVKAEATAAAIVKEDVERNDRYRQLIAEIPVPATILKYCVHLIS